eukprot:g58900.t1
MFEQSKQPLSNCTGDDDNMAQGKINEMQDWLKEQGLDSYANDFKRRRITLEGFFKLTDQDLIDMGIAEQHKKQIKQAYKCTEVGCIVHRANVIEVKVLSVHGRGLSPLPTQIDWGKSELGYLKQPMTQVGYANAYFETSPRGRLLISYAILQVVATWYRRHAISLLQAGRELCEAAKEGKAEEVQRLLEDECVPVNLPDQVAAAGARLTAQSTELPRGGERCKVRQAARDESTWTC